ncbi:MAG: TlpA family protein disulfide reductase [Pirellulales bacterium]|nr:TlpA family protein disulfide reductase [Pirellulales bacterium]
MPSSKKRSVWLKVVCLSACVGIVCAGISITIAADKPADEAGAKPAENAGVKMATETRAAKAAEFTDPGKPVDPFAVPDGTVDEIYAYIKTLDKARPTSNDRTEMMNFVKNLIAARNKACEKILAADVPVEKKKPAGAMLLETIRISLQIGDPQAIKALETLPAKYEKLKMPKLAEASKSILLQVHLQMAIFGMPGAPPLDEVLVGFKKLVEKDPNPRSIQMVMAIVDRLSQSGKTAEAIDLCNWTEKTFGKSTDKNVALIAGMVKGTCRRLQLPGKTMVVKGKTLDGKPYDLAQKKGKVVLVQYWATWCQPCVVEIANVLKNYELYHDRGFDVIGISIDEDKAALEDFLKKDKLPWPVLLDSEAKESNAMRYGVTGVPQLILVDKQGKVVTLNARGPKLGEELEKLLGPSQKKVAESIKLPQLNVSGE